MSVLLTASIKCSSEKNVSRIKKEIQLSCKIEAVTNVAFFTICVFNFVFNFVVLFKKIFLSHSPAVLAGGVGLHSPPLVSASCRM